MMSTRSERLSASSWSWVTETTLTPRVRWMLAISFCMVWRSLRSSAPRGSSMSNRPGVNTVARARATRCCWPPESWLGRFRRCCCS
ncbi:hypothetical protein BVC93_14415 [Mycobacterium sp. MS1601]|nr:hypothetical protein BVC93_14415 [Mycobacterium sp. MS1601]